MKAISQHITGYLKALDALFTQNTLPFAYIILHTIAWRNTTGQNEQGHQDNGRNNDFAHDRRSISILSPCQLGIRDVCLDFISAKLVEHESDESDGVAKGLKARHGVEEDDHGGNDEEDVLEDAGKSKDKRGGFSDLWHMIC